MVHFFLTNDQYILIGHIDPAVRCLFPSKTIFQMEYNISKCHMVLYLFGYNTEFFPFKNNPKILDPSYKMDLDLWGKTCIIAKFYQD